LVLQQQSEEGQERCTKTNGGRRPGCSTHRGCRGGCGFRLQNWRGGVLWQRKVDNGLRLGLEGDGNSLPSMLRKGGKGRKKWSGHRSGGQKGSARGVRSGRAADAWSCGGRGGGPGGDQDPTATGTGCARCEQGKDGALTGRPRLQYPS
jgi:hypothetical protein